MKNTELNIAQRIWLECLWQSSRLFAVMPYWFKYYVVENVLFVLLCYCLRYRVKVVKNNLKNSFPEKSGKELAAIRRKFYLTLAEVIVDTINMTHMGVEKARRMVRVKDFEAHCDAVHGRDWIAMTAHYGCWEYCGLWGVYAPNQITVAVYHPLSNSVMECFYQRLRNQHNSVAVPMKESLLFYLRHRDAGIDGKRLVIGLIADQNPPRRPDSHWFRFLNQDTIFFDGGEKLAVRCHLPVYFVNIVRLQRGCYELSFEQIYDGKEQLAEYEITERYVCKLEAMIRECPELWMWSHRRWKHKRSQGDS